MQQRTARQSPTMRHFSTLAGSFQKQLSRNSHTVQFTDLLQSDNIIYRYWTKIVAYGALLLTLGITVILFMPSHWIVVQQPASSLKTYNWLMLGCLILLQLLLMAGTYSAARSTVRAKDPVPVRPPKGLKVAFATTRAPNEPVYMVKTTLLAMKRARYKGGQVDVWLLDETKDPILNKFCKDTGVRYFSRKDIDRWNTPKPLNNFWRRKASVLLWILTFGKKSFIKKLPKPDTFMAGRSKHGNFNSWRAYLKQKRITYDILAGVDTDQVPEPNFLERLLGYFHDRNVAFVVGPQVYGNYRSKLEGLVARWSESQASFFQSTIQRAGNASTSAMFVGTNYAVRMSVLDQINGFQPCITEDMATGLVIHTKRNPTTGAHWKSVYTPDVLAIGEGPELWAPYFTQQWRWAAGNFDTWRRVVWREFYKLSPKAMLHYFLILTFYPITALTWLVGIISTMTYFLTGATAIIAPWSQFITLYLMSLTMQMSLYVWNRRFNVSPHEPVGSYGIAGMMLTSLTAPVYLSALIGVVLGKKPSFVVTSKGTHDRSYDTLITFKSHLIWAVIISAGLIYGFTHNHDQIAMWIWAVAQLIVCFIPIIVGWVVWLPSKLNKVNVTKPKIISRESANA